MEYDDFRKAIEGIEDEETRNGALEFADAMRERNDSAEAYREEADKRMADLEGKYSEMEQTYKDQISSLKARNYDLLMQVPGQSVPDPVPSTTLDTGEVVHIEDIFDFEGGANAN